MAGWRDVAVWQRLEAEGGGADGLVTAAAGIDAADAAAVARLRRRFDADLVSAALELAEARRKAAGKFDGAERLWCDVQGVEQASGTRVARWKAARVANALGAAGWTGEVLDVCCGIGGDAIELKRAGLAVRAIDLDPRRAWMAGRNAGCAVEARDAESIDPDGLVLHADPARRDERAGSRSWNIDDHRPGRAWIERVLRAARGAAIKFSPGVDRRAFEQAGVPSDPLEWEFIEVDGRLQQAVAWAGALARSPGATRATLLGTAAHSLCGAPDDRRADRISAIERDPRAGEFVNEPAAALERARLLTEAASGAAQEIERGLGLLVSEAPLAAPWFEAFEVVAPCAARADAISEVIRAHALRPRSVRVRGAAADADRLTRDLGCTPSGDAVAFVYRAGRSPRALVARTLTGTPGRTPPRA